VSRVTDIVAKCGGKTVEATDEKQRAPASGRAARRFRRHGQSSPRHDLHGRHHSASCPAVCPEEMAKLSQQYQLGFCNVFHAATAICIPDHFST